MAVRADKFLDSHLLPLLEARCGDVADVVAVVSHGIFLGVLWRALMHRFPPSSVSLAAGVGPSWETVPLEHLGGWSNTGYLELDLRKPLLVEDASPGASGGSTVVVPRLDRWCLQIKAINERAHLANLKRTRGGLGSSKFEHEQKKIDSFFQKMRTD